MFICKKRVRVEKRVRLYVFVIHMSKHETTTAIATLTTNVSACLWINLINSFFFKFSFTCETTTTPTTVATICFNLFNKQQQKKNENKNDKQAKVW